MGVDVRSDKLASLVDENVEVRRLGTGFTFTEGPIWNPKDQFLLFSDMPGDTRRRWDEANGVQEVLSPSNKGNGMTLDADGRLLVCEHTTSSLVRMDPDGKNTNREVLASHYEGKELNSPNDVVVRSDGSIWFSDPWYGRMPVFGVERERELGWQGVFRLPVGGGEPELVVEQDEYEQPNGLCFSPDESLLYVNDTPKAWIKVYDAEGNLLVCEHVTSSLVRERPDGTRETLATHYNGKELNSPNDVCVRSDGTIYFSDPWYGRMPGFGLERDRDLGFQGVYILRPGFTPGDEPELAVAEDEFEMPNGLCFSPDESLMYINDTPRAHIKLFDVAADGTLSNGRMFFEGIGSGVIEEGIPDGMKIDERGNVWVTGPRGVWVISPEGEHLGVVEVPENTGNMTWGDEDWKSLYIPSSTSLYRIRTRVGPARLPYHP